jgi:hypothetical protein
VIQEISGHRNLEQLQGYLEVQPDQVLGAIAQAFHALLHRETRICSDTMVYFIEEAIKQKSANSMTLDLPKLYKAYNPTKPLAIGNDEDKKCYIDFSFVRGGEIIEELEQTISLLSPDDPTCQIKYLQGILAVVNLQSYSD